MFLILQYSTFKSTVVQYNSWHTGHVYIFESSQLEGSYVGDFLYSMYQGWKVLVRLSKL